MATVLGTTHLLMFLDANVDRFGPVDGLDVEVQSRLDWADGTVPTGEFD